MRDIKNTFRRQNKHKNFAEKDKLFQNSSTITVKNQFQ